MFYTLLRLFLRLLRGKLTKYRKMLIQQRYYGLFTEVLRVHNGGSKGYRLSTRPIMGYFRESWLAISYFRVSWFEAIIFRDSWSNHSLLFLIRDSNIVIFRDSRFLHLIFVDSDQTPSSPPPPNMSLIGAWSTTCASWEGLETWRSTRQSGDSRRRRPGHQWWGILPEGAIFHPGRPW